MSTAERHVWGPKERYIKHVAAYHHSDITVVTRERERETGKREKERYRDCEREREREREKEKDAKERLGKSEKRD